MNIVITMAGIGARFRAAGWTVPKYRIEVRGKTLFEWSMSSLESFRRWQFIFIVRREDQSREFITSTCAGMGIEPRIIELDRLTKGQAETALLASNVWQENEPLMVYNIDTYVEPGQLRPELLKGDGFIPCFAADGTHWSFVRLDSDGRALEVQEKVRISDHCSIGAYYFRSAKLYSELYDEFYIQSNVEKEYYIAPMYNRLIERGGEVRIQSIDSKYVHVLGTPEEVEAFAQEVEV